VDWQRRLTGGGEGGRRRRRRRRRRKREEGGWRKVDIVSVVAHLHQIQLGSDQANMAARLGLLGNLSDPLVLQAIKRRAVRQVEAYDRCARATAVEAGEAVKPLLTGRVPDAEVARPAAGLNLLHGEGGTDGGDRFTKCVVEVTVHQARFSNARLPKQHQLEVDGLHVF
jgi:hypothetical protein